MPARRSASSAALWALPSPSPDEPHSTDVPAELRRWLTLAEAAEHVDVSTRTIRRWILERELPAVAIGKVVRVDRDRLDAWLESHSATPRGVAR